MPTVSPKIMIATLGTRGDVQPYVALAGELVRLGADVVLSTGEGFEDMIERSGARARSAPINFQSLLQKAEIKEALHSLSGKFKAARQNIALQQKLAKALFEIGLAEKPDLILFNLKATVMTLVGRRLKTPALPTALQPVLAATGAFPLALFGLPDMGSFFNRKSYGFARQLMALGLRPIYKPLRTEAATEISMSGSTIDGHMPGGGAALSLQAFSRALVPTPDDWREEFWQCGYWFTDPDPDFHPPAELERFLGEGAPPLYLGFGSMPSKNPKALTETVVNALGRTGQRAILASGWGGLEIEALPAEFGDRVLVIDKAPHSWLFPRCSGVVHHGGAGTTHEAVRWGKPSLVCPVFGDQPFWGQQVHRIGAGPLPIRQKNLMPDTLATALKDLEDPKYRQGASSASDIIAQEPGAQGTAVRLMELAER